MSFEKGIQYGNDYDGVVPGSHTDNAVSWKRWLQEQVKEMNNAKTWVVQVPDKLGDLSMFAFVEGLLLFKEWCKGNSVRYRIALAPLCDHGDGPWINIFNDNDPTEA